jgi:hypothetical protein
MAPSGVRPLGDHDHVSMRRQRRRSMPAGGLEIVHREVAENRVGALGGKLFLADLADNMRRRPWR